MLVTGGGGGEAADQRRGTDMGLLQDAGLISQGASRSRVFLSTDPSSQDWLGKRAALQEPPDGQLTRGVPQVRLPKDQIPLRPQD